MPEPENTEPSVSLNSMCGEDATGYSTYHMDTTGAATTFTVPSGFSGVLQSSQSPSVPANGEFRTIMSDTRVLGSAVSGPSWRGVREEIPSAVKDSGSVYLFTCPKCEEAMVYNHRNSIIEDQCLMYQCHECHEWSEEKDNKQKCA